MKLELKNISVELSNKKILKSINLTVEDGEYVSLLGASGCGKSTMLKTIAGIINQNEGSIILGGNSLEGIAPHKRKTVIVFQDFRLFPHLTVLENIGFPLKMNGTCKAEWEKRSKELLKKVRLEGFENKYAHELSGGQAQRVALARALASDPLALLLDEPFSSLDVNLKKEMRQLVLDLQKEFKITTIMVTHDHEEALFMSDRIAFMYDGKIEQFDSPENIFKNPANVKVANYFLEGIYIDGTVSDNQFKSEFFNIEVDKNDGEYKCLVRPQSIKMVKSSYGDFKVIEKVYLGDNYLFTLYNPSKDLKLESVGNTTTDIWQDDFVSIVLDKEKLVFIPI